MVDERDNANPLFEQDTFSHHAEQGTIRNTGIIARDYAVSDVYNSLELGPKKFSVQVDDGEIVPAGLSGRCAKRNCQLLGIPARGV